MEGDDQFIKWHKDLVARHQDENDKTQAIAMTIKKCYIFDDVEVTIYPTLVKTIVKRDWTVSDIGKGATLVNAERSLPPFSMLFLTEEDVALMQ